jgi:uncharacterized Ntn-hydrolase superfamily protein
MNILKHVCLTFLFLLSVGYSFATWSIIVVDPETGTIGIAGASCTQSVYGIGSIVPGKGAIVVQAMSNPFARAAGLKMIREDRSPQDILEAIRNPEFDPEHQQYAIVTLPYATMPATYTGKEASDHKGTLTANGISVQGNILAGPDVLMAVLEAALMARKDGRPLEEILLLALEAGAQRGGDRRCGELTASSAFLTVAKAADDRKNPFINLVVYGTAEKVNAVSALRTKFNDWKWKQVL